MNSPKTYVKSIWWTTLDNPIFLSVSVIQYLKYFLQNLEVWRVQLQYCSFNIYLSPMINMKDTYYLAYPLVLKFEKYLYLETYSFHSSFLSFKILFQSMSYMLLLKNECLFRVNRIKENESYIVFKYIRMKICIID